ncbi:MAG: GatB/YqeY domain-containing protein [Deltaproteobacteria bacterium]|nr:GatB/YqeY domain-containing protein [Deltaproteobacteria bacterium]
MGLVERVNDEMKGALKSKQAERLVALRNIRAAFLYEMKKDGASTLADEAAIAALRKLEKQRQESIEAFSKGGREEMAAAERAELAVIQAFLPSLADEATTSRWVDEAIAASGATSAKELGKVMGALMKAHKGDIDGNLARAIAAKKLGG